MWAMCHAAPFISGATCSRTCSSSTARDKSHLALSFGLKPSDFVPHRCESFPNFSANIWVRSPYLLFLQSAPLCTGGFPGGGRRPSNAHSSLLHRALQVAVSRVSPLAVPAILSIQGCPAVRSPASVPEADAATNTLTSHRHALIHACC
ncbi:uncharacterized protein KZ484_006872 [Pholidichthys leucotaenia]